MRGADVGDPIPHGFVDGILQRTGAGTDPADLGPQQPHAVNVEFLTAHVLLAHVDDAFHSEERTDGCGGYAVLPCTGFGNDAMLAHSARQQSLAKAVVDLVGASVEQVLTFEVDFCSPELPSQTRCQI